MHSLELFLITEELFDLSFSVVLMDLANRLSIVELRALICWAMKVKLESLGHLTRQFVAVRSLLRSRNLVASSEELWLVCSFLHGSFGTHLSHLLRSSPALVVLLQQLLPSVLGLIRDLLGDVQVV